MSIAYTSTDKTYYEAGGPETADRARQGKDTLANAERADATNGAGRRPHRTARRRVRARNRTQDGAGGPSDAAPGQPNGNGHGAIARTQSAPSVTRGVLAITNARIFPIATPPFDRGTVVMHDGIIESVGANVSVPPGAQIIDAGGADVYRDSSTRRRRWAGGSGRGAISGDANELLDFQPAAPRAGGVSQRQ